MNHVRRKVAAAAGAVVLSTLVACGSGGADAGNGGALSLDRLVTLANEVGEDGSDNCPLPYDVDKAGEAAKLGDAIKPGAAEAEQDEPMATADNGTKPEPGTAWANNPGALVSCSFHVGGDDLKIHTIGGEKQGVVSILAPLIQRADGTDLDELAPYINNASKKALGKATPSQSGNVVTIRLDSGGKGDVAMVVTAGTSGKTSLKPEQVLELARTFAAQAK